MPEIPPIIGQNAALRTSQAPTPSPIGDEFSSFIQLLTAQVQNQDPLEPMDSTQFVEQLATFSSLEQQVRSNDKLDSIATLIGELKGAIAGEWLGQTVSVPSTAVALQSEPVRLETEIPEGADAAALVIRDAKGETIWSDKIDSDTGPYEWDGRTLAGGTAERGNVYRLSMELFAGDRHVGSIAPRIITSVTDLSSQDGRWRLATAAGVTADLEDARRIGDV